MGPNLFFGEKQLVPSTSEGTTLLAHELTHVVQQSGGAPAPQRQAAGSQRQNTNVDLARKRGKAMVVRVKRHGKLSKEARAKINSDLAFFEGAAKDAYIEEVKPALMAVTKSAGPAPPAPPRSQTMEGLSAATPCGCGPCFTDEQIYGSQTAAARSEEAEQDKDRDAVLNDLRSRMNGWRTECIADAVWRTIWLSPQKSPQ